ncbi:hypothetical protein IFT73_14565 [Aeromicrobium sp. CFBP 8757]|uniref:hypothetical protein n=1 Tax=Aeromicrobium sp. CFBP 8757 TaxID=2775288 RepID=UPI00177C76A6|nr:hypothetical protein [Aeromicrobium sp. CFBP 8757]MBD8608078.1 hypothetical protein [Aeromicrobium sp. CFBP 8757]
MTSVGRRLVTFLPIVVTLLIAAVVGALIVVQDHRESQQVARADEAAEDYLSDVGMFRGDVAREVGAVAADDPAALRRALRSAIADPPTLPSPPPDGVERSETYATALETAETLLDRYARLDRELRRAQVALDFVGAARDALALRATDLVGFGPIGDSAAVRSRLIPAFVAARDELARVRVPKGQEALARTVRDALQVVIDRATVLADSIDANRSFSFSYADEFTAAIAAVDDYATTVEGDLAEAVAALEDVR